MKKTLPRKGWNFHFQMKMDMFLENVLEFKLLDSMT